MRVLFSPRAIDDLNDIWDWVANNDLASSNRIADTLHQRANRLSHHPFMGAPRPDIDPQARVLVEERWLILYRVDESSIRIVRILDGARDLAKLWPN